VAVTWVRCWVAAVARWRPLAGRPLGVGVSVPRAAWQPPKDPGGVRVTERATRQGGRYVARDRCSGCARTSVRRRHVAAGAGESPGTHRGLIGDSPGTHRGLPGESPGTRRVCGWEGAHTRCTPYPTALGGRVPICHSTVNGSDPRPCPVRVTQYAETQAQPALHK